MHEMFDRCLKCSINTLHISVDKYSGIYLSPLLNNISIGIWCCQVMSPVVLKAQDSVLELTMLVDQSAQTAFRDTQSL